jgi:hypothetical protein
MICKWRHHTIKFSWLIVDWSTTFNKAEMNSKCWHRTSSQRTETKEPKRRINSESLTICMIERNFFMMIELEYDRFTSVCKSEFELRAFHSISHCDWRWIVTWISGCWFRIEMLIIQLIQSYGCYFGANSSNETNHDVDKLNLFDSWDNWKKLNWVRKNGNGQQSMIFCPTNRRV